jgi:hypothetical protein
MHHIALFKFNIASLKFLFNSFSYCIHKRTVNVIYSQINSFSLLFVKSPDFLSLEKKISRFFTLRLAGLKMRDFCVCKWSQRLLLKLCACFLCIYCPNEWMQNKPAGMNNSLIHNFFHFFRKPFYFRLGWESEFAGILLTGLVH